MSNKTKVGLIGCGNRQKGHVEALRQLEDVEIVACADLVPELRDKFVETYDIPRAYASSQDMVAAEDLDIVTVVTAPKYRVGPVRDAALGGVKGIVVEKPMATSLAEADEMLAVCEQSGSLLVVNHQYRFLPDAVEMKRRIDGGDIGEVEFLRTTSHNRILGQGTHMIDLARYMHGDRPFRWAMGAVAGADDFDGKIPGPKSDAAVFCFDDDVHLYMECGPQAPHHPGESPFYNCYVEAVGTEGRLWMGINAGMRGWTRGEGAFQTDGDYARDNVVAQKALVMELIKSLRDGVEHRTRGALARKTQEAIEAHFLSASRMERVEFPLPSGEGHLESVRARMAAS